MLHFAADAAFDELLARWRHHEQNRGRIGTSVVELAASRAALDRARDRMHQLRVNLHPEGHEREAVVASLWCESLEAVVHLRRLDRCTERAGRLWCPCGRLVEVAGHPVRAPLAG